MSISDAQYAAWLSQENKRRVVLVEADYSGGTKYFSTFPYVSGPSDTPANIAYDDLLLGVPSIAQAMGKGASIGDLAVSNTGGLVDSWWTLAFAGWPLRLYLGDAAWTRDDFRLIFQGVTEEVTTSGRDQLGFSIRDRRELLSQPVQTARIGTNNEVVPLSFGTCFNVSPKLTNGATHEYQVHESAVNDITAVRDNGVAVAYTKNLANGKFTLNAAPAGQITADVTETASGGTVAGVVQTLLRRRFPSETLNTSFSMTSPIGIYIDRDRDILECIKEVAETAGAVLTVSRTDGFWLHRLETPSGLTSVATFEPDDIEQGSLRISKTELPKLSVVLGAERNWTEQDPASLAGAVTEANRQLYSRPYQIVKATNSGIAASYPSARDDEMVGTLFTTTANATTEASRRAGLRQQIRFTFRLRALCAPFSLQIGDCVTLKHPRFGLSSGSKGRVVSVIDRPSVFSSELEVWL